MHSDHRRRYHVRPAADVYPGDRISTDQQAIDAVDGDRRADAAVDWEKIERDAELVRDRTRTAQTQLTFRTGTGKLPLDLDAQVLVVRERRDGTVS